MREALREALRLSLLALEEKPVAGSAARVVLVKANLPTLVNPLTDLVGESLRQLGLREAQIHELRDLAVAGDVELIFLLDAYDELRPEVRMKNLYTTNNLEQYRSKSLPEGALKPKVIVTTRSELLSGKANYYESFYPKELDEKSPKREGAFALGCFMELRLASFASKVPTYVEASAFGNPRQWPSWPFSTQKAIIFLKTIRKLAAGKVMKIVLM